MAKTNNTNIGFEKQIWDAACVLWGHIPAAEYRKVIVGLIFLRYISGAFEKRYQDLVAITKELTEALRRNKTIDWQKRESARAKMRMMIKKLLKKHKYPPEGMEDAVKTVMTQCELWTDNADF